MKEEDERIEAWHTIAAHPFFQSAYVQPMPLVDAMVRQLDEVHVLSPRADEPEATQAEEPVEWRILRAFTNGFAEGLRRGHEGRLDR